LIESSAPTQEERLIAGLTHLSIMLSLFIVSFWVPWVICAVVYFVFKGRSPYLRKQALQALVFQIVCIAVGGFLITLGVPTVELFIGAILILIGAFIILVGCILGIVATVQCFKGRDYSYPLIGGWFS